MDRCIEQRTTWKTIENFWAGHDRLCTATPLGNSITMVYGTLSTMINKIFKKIYPLESGAGAALFIMDFGEIQIQFMRSGC